MIPKILFHGTSRWRWEIPIKRDGLKGDVPRAYKNDIRNMGWVYFTDTLENAAAYAINQVLIENLTEKGRKLNEIVGNQGIILAVRTSGLKGIEPDPEDSEVRKELLLLLAEGDKEKLMKMGYWWRRWYRYKGTIPHKLIMPYQDVPLDRQNPFLLMNAALAIYGRPPDAIAADFSTIEMNFDESPNKTIP